CVIAVVAESAADTGHRCWCRGVTWSGEQRTALEPADFEQVAMPGPNPFIHAGGVVPACPGRAAHFVRLPDPSPVRCRYSQDHHASPVPLMNVSVHASVF